MRPCAPGASKTGQGPKGRMRYLRPLTGNVCWVNGLAATPCQINVHLRVRVDCVLLLGDVRLENKVPLNPYPFTVPSGVTCDTSLLHTF